MDQDCVDVILAEVDRLSNLVTDLMLYTREREPTIGPMDLCSLAQQTAELCRAEGDKAQVAIEVEGQGAVQGDQDLSRQALLNVVRNGIQASAPGSVLKMVVEEDHILIVDQGKGVPEEIRDDLFTPFVTGRTRGLGLGAAVARRCLRRQGGEIDLRSTSADGTTFCMRWATPDFPD